MRIYITGIAGFLGSHLADAFLADGHQVKGCDNLLGGVITNVSRQASFSIHDITSGYIDQLAAYMEGCDVVYHCAAAPYEGVSVFSPAFISDNIFSGSVNVFTAAIKAGVKRIVYCSSMARYGTNKTPFKETFTPKPQDPYGIAKEAAERVLKTLADVHGIEYVIAVPHNIYGPRQRYWDPYRNVASIMANLILQGRQPIIYGDGSQVRCFSYIDDCLSCLAKLATQENVVGHTINIGPDSEAETVTIWELAMKIHDIIYPPNVTLFDPIFYPDRPQEVKVAYCSSNKARKLLGYETKTSLDEGLTNLVDWIKLNGPRAFQYHFDLEIKNHKTPQTWIDKVF